MTAKEGSAAGGRVLTAPIGIQRCLGAGRRSGNADKPYVAKGAVSETP
jgi:hypothetical protein